MNNFSNTLSAFISNEARKYNISFFVAATLLFFPFLIIILAFLALKFPPTREFTILMCRENYPVDSLSFGFLFFAVVFGIILIFKMKKIGAGKLQLIFLGVISFSFFIIAMEEIAWGQQLLNFRTPEYFETINIEDDIKLQSFSGLQNNTGYFRLALGLTGLIGILFVKFEKLKVIAVPKILFGGFFVITIVAFIHLLSYGTGIADELRWISQVIELMIAISAFLYVWLLNRKVKYNNRLYGTAHSLAVNS
jgi:hypothetical protein